MRPLKTHMPKISAEEHPLHPFWRTDSILLMLGSFPPPREKWCMEFYYPNFQNDMWRIFGLAFFGDKSAFITAKGKSFDREKIEGFLISKKIALSDTAASAVRLKGNASDKFLQIARPLNLGAAMAAMPNCKAVAATGEKAAEAFAEISGAPPPEVGRFAEFAFQGKRMKFFRMPSSSRAYPLAIQKKAAVYAEMFRSLGLLDRKPCEGGRS